MHIDDATPQTPEYKLKFLSPEAFSILKNLSVDSEQTTTFNLRDEKSIQKLNVPCRK